MSILIDKQTRVLVQGMGKEGAKAAVNMRNYGTVVLAGVTPGKGGQEIEGVPIFNTVREAMQAFPDINVSMVCVPPAAVRSAAFEAIDSNIPLIVIVTEKTPIHDSAKIIAYAKNTVVVGPASIGIISPGRGKVGFIGGEENLSFSFGPVGIISKSGGMSSETALILSQKGIGQSTVVGIGGDMLIGSTYVDLLKRFEQDPETKIIVLYCEIGGTYEEEAAAFIKSGCNKPVVAFISGTFASTIQDVALGHAGAIIEGSSGTRESKHKALTAAGVHVVEVHHEIADKVEELLKKM